MLEYEEFGFIPLLPIALGITGISGALATYFITHPKKPAEVVASKIEKCAKELEEEGYSPEAANRICLERYRVAQEAVVKEIQKKPLSITEVIFLLGLGALSLYAYKTFKKGAK